MWRLYKPLKYTACVLGVAAALWVVWSAWIWRNEPTLSPKGLSSVVVWALVIPAIGVGAIVKAINYPKTLRQALIGAGLCVFGSVVALIHLFPFDWLFLRIGRREEASATSHRKASSESTRRL